MNPELLQLLAEAGIERRLTWRDIVVLQNYGPVPVPPEWAGIRNLERGLNFLILDGTRPTHFCKCRSAGNADLNRETIIRKSLAAVDAGLCVPSVESAASDVGLVPRPAWEDAGLLLRLTRALPPVES